MAIGKSLNRVDQLAFTELVEMARDAAFDRDFPSNGSFHKRERKGQAYWYYQRHAGVDDHGKQVIDTRYVGKAGDIDVESRIAAFGAIKDSHKVRRRLVAQLKGAGLPAPLKTEGAVISTLAKAGVFRVDGLLIGSMAYQSYPGMLGIRLPTAALATQDVDFAQDHGISLHVGDKTEHIGEALKAVDPSFREIPNLKDPIMSYAYVNRTGFKVEFLTSSRGSDEDDSGITKMPALTGTGASPLRHLDFLIRDPMTSVLVHDDGISVKVPKPERYAVHKLIVATKRHDTGESAAKAVKDIAQAGDLFTALAIAGRTYDLSESWQEAWGRGPGWRKRLAQGAIRLDPEARGILAASVAAFSERHGFKKGVDPVSMLARFATATLPSESPARRTSKRRGDDGGQGA